MAAPEELVKALAEDGTKFLGKAVAQGWVVGDGAQLLSGGTADGVETFHWHMVCDACVKIGSMAPVVQVVVARFEDGPNSQFLVEHDKSIHDWVVSASQDCRAAARSLEAGLNAPGAALGQQYAALDVRCGHVFSVLRALLVRLRWRIVLDCERYLHDEVPADEGTLVATTVALDASRERVRRLLQDAKRASNSALITTSVDAVVQSWGSLDALRAALLDRLAAIERVKADIGEDLRRTDSVYEQRMSLLDAMSELRSRAEAGAEDPRKEQLKADHAAFKATYNRRLDVLHRLQHGTNDELRLLSWLLALHHLRQRVACGRWVVDAFAEHSSGGAVTLHGFAHATAAIDDALPPPQASFWAALWAGFTSHLVGVEVPPPPTTTGALPSLLDLGSGAIDVASPDAPPVPHPDMTALLGSAFAAHDAAGLVTLYATLFQSMQPLAGADLTPDRLLDVKHRTNIAVASFARVLGGLPAAQAVLVLVLLDVATQPPAGDRPAWIVEWALDLFHDPSVAWAVRSAPDSVPAKVLGGSTGVVGRRMLELGHHTAVVESYRSLWPHRRLLSPANALIMVEALLACDRWMDAFAVARGLPAESEPLLKACFTWFADGRWDRLLALPLDAREGTLLDQCLASLHETSPELRTNELRLVYRMSRLQPLTDVPTNLSKRRVADPSSSATKLTAIVKHYNSTCAPPLPASASAPLARAVPSSLATSLRRWRLHSLTAATTSGAPPPEDVELDGEEEEAGAAPPTAAGGEGEEDDMWDQL